MQHHFTVPVPVDVAWPALIDPERVAPCMPGATLTRAEGNEFAGSVKVKLGPISLLYKGTGSFQEVDAEAHRVVIDASGKDARGNGTAAATVTATLAADGASTAVQVDTDLKVTGKPAQLGRGLMSEVGGKILNQFAGCLAEKLAAGEEVAEAPAAAATDEAKVADVAKATAERQPSAERPAAASDGGARAARSPAWRVTPPAGERADAPASASTAGEAPSERADAVVTGQPVPPDEAIDLLGTAGAPVLKRVVPAVAVFVAAMLLFRWLRRRRHR